MLVWYAGHTVDVELKQQCLRSCSPPSYPMLNSPIVAVFVSRCGYVHAYAIALVPTEVYTQSFAIDDVAQDCRNCRFATSGKCSIPELVAFLLHMIYVQNIH
jgi:hypothetical protein